MSTDAPDPDLVLAEQVLGLLDPGMRAEWGWERAVVLEPDDPRWVDAATVRMDAGGLRVPMYNGLIDLLVAARTVVFLAIDQRAPHEQRWEFHPDEEWWQAVGRNPNLEYLVADVSGAAIGGAERMAWENPGREPGPMSYAEIGGQLGVSGLTLFLRDRNIKAHLRRQEAGPAGGS